MKIEIVCAFFSVGTFFLVCSGNTIEDGFARSLTYIGVFNGHQFFQVDNTSTPSYDMAKERCSIEGMRLARIVSVSEIEFLVPILPNQGDYYWTSGKSNAASFSWDDGSFVIAPVLSLPQSCMYLTQSTSSIRNLACTTSAYVLCDNAL